MCHMNHMEDDNRSRSVRSKRIEAFKALRRGKGSRFRNGVLTFFMSHIENRRQPGTRKYPAVIVKKQTSRVRDLFLNICCSEMSTLFLARLAPDIRFE